MRRALVQERRVCRVLCVLIAAQVTLGCGGTSDGPTVAPVKGVVTLNGKPVEGVQVIFSVKDGARSSYGATNDKGEYELTTMNTNDGAIVGENLVAIRQTPKESADLSAMPSAEAMKSGKAPMGVKKPSGDAKKSQNSSVIPAKYADAEKSGLKRTVVLGEPNNFDFDLKP